MCNWVELKTFRGQLVSSSSWFFSSVTRMEVRCRITHSSMNDLLLSGALEYLESCPGVCIEANSNPPIVPTMIGHWESQYKQKLPQDLKDFLSVSDGWSFLILKYRIQYKLVCIFIIRFQTKIKRLEKRTAGRFAQNWMYIDQFATRYHSNNEFRACSCFSNSRYYSFWKGLYSLFRIRSRQDYWQQY